MMVLRSNFARISNHRPLQNSLDGISASFNKGIPEQLYLFLLRVTISGKLLKKRRDVLEKNKKILQDVPYENKICFEESVDMK